jgi:hypothetical protein
VDKQHQRGFLLVLVIEDGEEGETSARVCRDYDVTTVDELEQDLALAAAQTANQLRLRAAAERLLKR